MSIYTGADERHTLTHLNTEGNRTNIIHIPKDLVPRKHKLPAHIIPLKNKMKRAFNRVSRKATVLHRGKSHDLPTRSLGSVVCTRTSDPDPVVCTRTSDPDPIVCTRMSDPDQVVCTRTSDPYPVVCTRTSDPDPVVCGRMSDRVVPDTTSAGQTAEAGYDDRITRYSDSWSCDVYS